eukprot:12396477-Alexandrium_andersonii.AAC.1
MPHSESTLADILRGEPTLADIRLRHRSHLTQSHAVADAALLQALGHELQMMEEAAAPNRPLGRNVLIPRSERMYVGDPFSCSSGRWEQ